MINGAHAIIYSKDADADRAFLRDVLGFPNVDVGGGWLIFGLPPSEVAVHPGTNSEHEFFLMCDDVEALIADMKKRKVKCGPIHEERWGRLTEVSLPGGGKLGIYEPKHPRPKSIVR
jgi:catechol 2,3-dioxygenase-like lactoylglutathione lyase family enzyme